MSSLNILFVGMNKFLTYFRPIVFTLGMIGNGLDVLLFSRRRFRTVSCCTYFLSAAILIMIQFSFVFSVLFYAYSRVNPLTSMLAICKIYMYVQQSIAMMQRWLIAAASFDRYACSSSHAGLRRFATVHVARRVVLAIMIIWFVIPVYRLVFYELDRNACGIFGNNVTALIHSIYTTVAAVFIPLSIMIPSVILIRRNLSEKRERRKHIVIQLNQGRNEVREMDRKRDQQVLAILLVQVIVYIILITPSMITYIYNAVTLSISDKSTDRIIIEQIVNSIAETLIFVYSTIPFYLNTITSHIFRHELMLILRHILPCRWLTHTNRINPNITNAIAKTPVAKVQSLPKPFVYNEKISKHAIKSDLEQANMNQNVS